MFLYTKILDLIPTRLKRFCYKTLYQYLARFEYPEWTFMNYGYTDGTLLELKAKDESNRYSIQLYDKAVGSYADLYKKDILEVGSGRGGGLAYLFEYHKPKSAIGIDLSSRAVEFCQNRFCHFWPNLLYTQGDASAIPFSDEHFDVVLNIESSHCYPSLPKFFREVYRVLRNKGYFVYTDLCAVDEQSGIEKDLLEAGFTIIEKENITQGVIDALALDDQRKSDMIGPRVPWYLKPFFFHFAGMKGSRTFKSFEVGARQYFRYLLKKEMTT